MLIFSNTAQYLYYNEYCAVRFLTFSAKQSGENSTATFLLGIDENGFKMFCANVFCIRNRARFICGTTKSIYLNVTF